MDELKRKGMFATMMFLCGCLLTAGTAMTEAKGVERKTKRNGFHTGHALYSDPGMERDVQTTA